MEWKSSEYRHGILRQVREVTGTRCTCTYKVTSTATICMHHGVVINPFFSLTCKIYIMHEWCNSCVCMHVYIGVQRDTYVSRAYELQNTHAHCTCTYTTITWHSIAGPLHLFPASTTPIAIQQFSKVQQCRQITSNVKVTIASAAAIVSNWMGSFVTSPCVASTAMQRTIARLLQTWKIRKTAFLLSLFLSSIGAANFYIGRYDLGKQIVNN